ncbi:tol-pal system-associated acyl-CoA thioesterase [Rhodobacteraceae bacterium XHP0102]|nr:tol-pal system-associated acyl-CoA thioesterase [Rhodobacteraceae bacterium XHP0102]
MTHHWPIRVYYEDTDLAGIVYYANYLKFIERARSEMVRGLGVDQAALKRDHDIVFAVRRVEADYRAPAKFDDELVVETKLVRASPVRLELAQDILRDGAVIFAAQVTLVTINFAGKVAKLPPDVLAKLS